EIYYYAQGEEPMLVSKIGCLAPGLLVLYGTDGRNNDCKVLAHLQTVHLTLKLVRNGAPEKRRTISFVEPARGSVYAHFAGVWASIPEERRDEAQDCMVCHSAHSCTTFKLEIPFIIRRTAMKRIAVCIAVLLVSSLAWAGSKTYQATGPVVDVRDDAIVVDKG